MKSIDLPRCGHSITTACALVAALLGGCATKAPQPYDYTAFKAAHPASLLVLPPLNDSPEVNASASVMSQVTAPLAEAGYYVLPVALVDETFKENGLSQPADIQALSTAKLREIFGADAGVYLRIKQYGSTYNVVSSQSIVEVEGRIVDLRTGALLWQGHAQASSAEGQSSQNTLVGMLVQAVLTQVLNNATDASYRVAGIAAQRLLNTNPTTGILPGPRAKPATGP